MRILRFCISAGVLVISGVVIAATATYAAPDTHIACLKSYDKESKQAACLEKAISNYCRAVSEQGGDRVSCLADLLKGAQRAAQNDEPAPVNEMSAAAANAEAQVPERAIVDSKQTATPASKSNDVESFGADQIAPKKKFGERIREKKESAMTATVSRLHRTDRGTYVFYLDNGQVWRQKDSDPGGILLSDEKQYVVTVSRGLFSGYRLKIHGGPRRILVERIK